LDKMKARGVMKHVHRYEPPHDLEDRLAKIVGDAMPSKKFDEKSLLNFSFSENGGNDLKFRIFSAAEQAFGKRIPASSLHEMKTVGDLVEFYRIPVKNVTTYIDMARSKSRLPKNLHISEEPKRFHPLTDGQTAFPGLSTVVTDLRERQFYKGFRAKKEWHHYQEKHFDYDKAPPNCPWDKKKSERYDHVNFRLRPEFP